METPFTDALSLLVNEFTSCYYPSDNTSVKIYLSKRFERALLSEISPAMNIADPKGLKVYMGYEVREGYEEKMIVVDMFNTQRIKCIEFH